MTLWAMTEQVVFKWSGFRSGDPNLLLFVFGAIILGFTTCILIEAVSMLFGDNDESSEPDKVNP